MSLPIHNWREVLGAISSYKSRYEAVKTKYDNLLLLFEPPFEVVPEVEVPGLWVEDVLAAAIPNWGKGVGRVPLDGKYYIPALEGTQKIIAWDLTDEKQYIRDRFDCENFAFSVKGRVDRLFGVNHFGLVIDWSGAHGYNIFLTPEGAVFIYEPQNDQYWSLADHDFKGIYALQQGVILI